jgi:glycyl-tRNA synthetase beta chain
MSDFLLELRSEEIPARMQARARNDLARMFAECTGAAGLSTGAIDVHSTPRRLALIARDVADQTEPSREELKGPRSSAPPQALDGFLRKTGLARDQLEERDGVYFALIERAGRPAAEVLAETVRRIVADFPWPKSMRWGDGSLRWVRPLHGIVAMLGERIVPVEIDGIASGATSVGHRFHHPGPITIGGAADYLEKLRACHVIVDQDERERLIRDGAEAAATAAGLALLPDEALVVENAGLTEWPVPLLGRFDPDYLDVPREVIVLTMRINQKYFACTIPPRAPLGEADHAKHGGGEGHGGKAPPPPSTVPLPQQAGGGLAPAIVCVANVDSSDGGALIVEGNRRVLAARLADARFFWEQDLKIPLEEQAKKLDGIVFHEKLGTLADKVERVAKLARWLVEDGIVGTLSPAGRGQGEGAATSSKTAGAPHPSPLPAGERERLADLAERAARLAKADLVTGMVGEFPELQGVIGG